VKGLKLGPSVGTIVVLVAVIAMDRTRNAGSGQTANASKSEPVKEALDRYFPNTETMGADEVRVIACGTGMPTARRSQAATCFLVELGNGDKFLFDIGSGSAIISSTTSTFGFPCMRESVGPTRDH
jgi:hypothetical protein